LQSRAFELTNAGDFRSAERIWTELISLNDGNAAAWSNRGNCRVSQGRFTDALEDFDRAVALAPGEPDCHLGRGVALEGVREWDAALREYEVADDCAQNMYGAPDPVTYNNRGNVYGLGLGDWATAAEFFHRASVMNRNYIFPRCSEALCVYQLGRHDEAVKMLTGLLRKYPEFCDVRAALVAIAWADGDIADAERNWTVVMEQDVRYKELDWVRSIRRWPPLLVEHLDSFVTLGKV
jgi:tetratricopeptide (TPR) repeat protein